MLSMCLLFCFVIFWMLCCVMCEEKKNADNKTHERAQSDWRLTCGTMRDDVGGGLNAMLSDYLMSHSQLKKQSTKCIILQ